MFRATNDLERRCAENMSKNKDKITKKKKKTEEKGKKGEKLRIQQW